jgi:adenylate kinase family enzyme
LFNIDSLFQKEFRLKTMCEWDFNVFNEKLGNKTEYGVVVGRSLSGKSTLSQHMCTKLGYKIIDMKSVTEKVKAKLGTEDEPFEGEVPIAKVEDEIQSMIKSCPKDKFIFDGFTHAKAANFIKFLERFGLPTFCLCLTASEKAIKERFCKKNEVDDVPEEAAEELKQQEAADVSVRQVMDDSYKMYQGRI